MWAVGGDAVFRHHDDENGFDGAPNGAGCSTLSLGEHLQPGQPAEKKNILGLGTAEITELILLYRRRGPNIPKALCVVSGGPSLSVGGLGQESH